MAALHAIAHDLTKPGLVAALVAFSILAFLATFIVVPRALVRLPPDYLSRKSEVRRGHPAVIVLKNIAGVILVLLGIAMLLLPGQGVLTLVLGLTLVDFPGRRRFERYVMTRRAVLKAINALRRRAKRPPLEVPPNSSGARSDRS